MEGLDALLALARSSQLGPTTRVRRDGQENWIRAERIPALRLHFSSDAWDEVPEDVDEEVDDAPEIMDLPMDAIELVVESSETVSNEPSVEELPEGALTPMNGPQMVVHSDNRSKRKRKQASPKREQPPVVLTPPPPNSISSTGELIEFPMGLDIVDEEHANPAVQALERLTKGTTATPTSAGVRWGRLVGFACLMFGGVAMLDFCVSTEATWSNPSVEDQPLTTVDGSVEEVLDGSLADIELDLREAISRRSPKRHDVSGKGLSSIEHDKKMEALIQRDLLFPMGVTPKLVNVTVASRQPGEQRAPRVLNLRLDIQSDLQKIDRDLGAVALVVGRLAAEIDPEKINSGSGDEFQIQLFVQGAASQTVYMNWTQARQFYQERLTLADFLEKLERE